MAERAAWAKAEIAARHLQVVAGEQVSCKDMSDEDLMLAHGEGSEDAFVELVRRHQKGVLNFTHRMVQNRQIAEEITQEVFLALVKNGQRYRPTAKFTTYLYAIASNMVSKEWLRRKRRPRLFSLFANWGKDSDDTFHPFEHVGDTKADTMKAFRRGEVSEALNEALQHLPEHQRETFILLRFQELSYEEIAAITKVPIGTAKSRVVRAERALRPLLADFREYV
ncbi:MAG TPA: sigma-70 family RNA polymerase sigma factor [Gammaproteobacteria bacterium]|jgi:RNA polymerase sigma-70 factor (ECF subfamily)|nr:sigma-70 family RNA polymerase sigma factor [Candidatus Hydrogenedentota bacterium]HJP35728.1 sigma-70 family RNA polymerase sigma factor [Gammaproteobacteria bacterium]